MGIDKAAGPQQQCLEKQTQVWPSSSRARPTAWVVDIRDPKRTHSLSKSANAMTCREKCVRKILLKAKGSPQDSLHNRVQAHLVC